MKNNVLYLRINSIGGNYAQEYLQIPFGLNVVKVCHSNKSMLWWKSDRKVQEGEIHMFSYPCKDQCPSRLQKSLEINEHSSVILGGFLLYFSRANIICMPCKINHDGSLLTVSLR